MIKFIDEMSLFSLLFLALFLGIAPYPMEAQPHAVEKILMLVNGELSKPLDIFDLLFHTFPTVILMIKIYRMYVLKLPQQRKQSDQEKENL